MKRVVSLLAAANVLAIPFVTRAAAVPPPAAAPPQPVPAPAPEPPSAAQPPPAAVPAPPPPPSAPPKVTLTPYGQILLLGMVNDGPFSQKDGGFQAIANHDNGAFIFSARGSRLGVKVGIPDDPWTGAKLNGIVEFDFKGGQIPSNVPVACTSSSTAGNPPSCATAVGAASTAWYNPVPRLRLAYLTAAWTLPSGAGKLTLVAGQDWGLIAPLSATSLAYGQDPLFQQGGNVWRRAPQLKLTYDFGGASFGGSLAAAALSPADNTFSAPSTPPQYAADYGAGNRSFKPNLEARAAAWYKQGGKKVAELGVSGHYDWRRYSPTASGSPLLFDDVTGKIIAADLQVNLPYVTVQGEGFLNDGADDSVNGIAPAVVTTGSTASTFTVTTVKSRGVWGQIVLKPIPEIQIPFGYGVESISDLAAAQAAGLAAGQRTRNYEISGGVIFNANNPWKFGFELLHTVSKYDLQTSTFAQSAEATQYTLATKLDF
jgi:hypothetical protein